MAKTRTVVRWRKARRAHRSKGGFTLPVAVLAGFMPMTGYALRAYGNGGFNAAGDAIIESLTGYSPAVRQFHPDKLMMGTGSIVAGLLVHKIIGGRMGVNRALSGAGVPFLRI